MVALIAGFGIGASTGAIPITALQIADAAGIMLLAVVVVFFGWLFTSSNWTPDERKKLYVIGVLFVAAALFWSVFEQAGSTLNLFADRNTHNVVFGWSYPSSWFQSLNSLFLIVFAPVFAWLWLRLARNRQEPSSPAKFAVASRVRRRRVRDPDLGGEDGRTGRAGQPDVADGHLSAAHVW